MERKVDDLLRELRLTGIANEEVLDAIRTVPREHFVPLNLRHLAYENFPLPIGADQTISQPYVVARMTELLLEQLGSRRGKILEIGTGSGYQAAILSKLVDEVYTLERIKMLCDQSTKALESYANVRVKYGDGRIGWPDAAPFDGIIVTAGSGTVPPELVEELHGDGCMVIPHGEDDLQYLTVVRKRAGGGVQYDTYEPVRFVPLLNNVS